MARVGGRQGSRIDPMDRSALGVAHQRLLLAMAQLDGASAGRVSKWLAEAPL